MLKHLINIVRPSRLHPIQQSLNHQHRLLETIIACLPSNLSGHCLHAISNKKKVVLYTDSSVWASKLLYMRTHILKSLAENSDAPIKTLKVKVLSKPASKTKSSLKQPSIKTVRLLNKANTFKQSDKLSESMNRLITALKKNKLSN